jgi:hypothetical protein
MLCRQLAKAKSTRGRINGNNFADGDSEFDALDKALGIGGELGGGVTPRAAGGRVVKVRVFLECLDCQNGQGVYSDLTSMFPTTVLILHASLLSLLLRQ